MSHLLPVLLGLHILCPDLFYYAPGLVCHAPGQVCPASGPVRDAFGLVCRFPRFGLV
jgi:hypothetical protein